MRLRNRFHSGNGHSSQSSEAPITTKAAKITTGLIASRDERNVSEVIGYQGQRADLGRRAEQQRTVQRVERRCRLRRLR